MRKHLFRTAAWLLIVWLPVYVSSPLFAQDALEAGDDYFSGYDDGAEENPIQATPTEDTEDTFEGATGDSFFAEEPESSQGPVAAEEPASSGALLEESMMEELGGGEPGGESFVATQAAAEDTRRSAVQNAVIEGVQIASEASQDEENVIVITVYFIFRDRPTSYFYETKLRDKKIVFEFNDTELGSSPIPSAQEPPIQGFRIEEEKVDVNKEVVGLNPEWHDVLKVSFYLDAVPKIVVKDEYSVVSFTFKWSTDPQKAKGYVVVQKGPRALLFSLLGVGVSAGVVAAVLFLREGEPEPGPADIDTTDLPIHPDPTEALLLP